CNITPRPRPARTTPIRSSSISTGWSRRGRPEKSEKFRSQEPKNFRFLVFWLPNLFSQPLLELYRVLWRVDTDGRVLGEIAGNFVAVFEHAQLLELLDLLEFSQRQLRELLQQLRTIAVKPEMLVAGVGRDPDVVDRARPV